MTGFDNRLTTEINPEKIRTAQLEFVMSEQLAKAVVPLLMPQAAYNRVTRGHKLLLETPPIKVPLAEHPELSAREAAWRRLPFNWQLNESKFYVRNITPGQNKLYNSGRKTDTELYKGVSWLFHLQKLDAVALGKVVHGGARIRPGFAQPLRLGVALSQHDKSLMMDRSEIHKRLANAREKLRSIGDDAYVFGKPLAVSKPINNKQVD